MSEQFRGVDGELFENLMQAANLPNGNDWLETTAYIAHLIGGSRLDRVTPDSGKPPPAGSVAEDRRASHEVVRREDTYAGEWTRVSQDLLGWKLLNWQTERPVPLYVIGEA